MSTREGQVMGTKNCPKVKFTGHKQLQPDFRDRHPKHFCLFLYDDESIQ